MKPNKRIENELAAAAGICKENQNNVSQCICQTTDICEDSIEILELYNNIKYPSSKKDVKKILELFSSTEYCDIEKITKH